MPRHASETVDLGMLKMDFRTFSVVEPLSLNWCKELFEYYWAGAKIGWPKGQESLEIRNKK